MATKVEDYVKELLDAAGIVDADQRKQAEALLGNDKVKSRLQNTLSDIEAEKGRVAAERTKYEEYQRSVNEAEQKNLQIFANNENIVKQAQAKVQAYVDTYGVLPDGSNPNNSNARTQAVQDAIDKKTFDERTSGIEKNTIALLGTALSIMDQHRREFPNEKFDVDGIIKYATEKGVTAQAAYDSMMSTKRQEAFQAKIETDKKAAVDAALIEERSKRGAGRIADSTSQNGFMSNLTKQLKDSQPTNARESFLSGWREPNPGDALRSGK